MKGVHTRRVIVLVMFLVASLYPFHLSRYKAQGYSLSKRYSKVFDSRLYCMTCTLEYPDVNDTDAAEFFRFLPTQIAGIVDHYHRCDPASIADPDGGTPTTDWYENLSVSLEYVTPATYTLMEDDESNLGGAHNYQFFKYRNYLKKNGKMLGYADLFKGDFNRTLTRIAERVYRKSVGISPHAPLDAEKPGWSENRFVLPKNFAITTRGLLLRYNVYEVTPYVSVLPEFLLPYSAIRFLIDPKGPLAFALDSDHSIAVELDLSNHTNMRMEIFKSGSRTLDIDATLLYGENKRPDRVKHSWLTLQFPALKDSHSIIEGRVGAGDDLKIYPAGSRLNDDKRKRPTRARWLQVEMEVPDASKRKDEEYLCLHRLHLRLHLPRKRPFVIYVRIANLLEDGTIDRAPDSGTPGQQGFPNVRILWGK